MFTFRVTPDGGEPYEVTATSRDVLVWEKAGPNRSMGGLLEQGIPMGAMYFLAHVASSRQGLWSGALRDFEQGVDLEMGEQAEGEADPTHAAP